MPEAAPRRARHWQAAWGRASWAAVLVAAGAQLAGGTAPVLLGLVLFVLAILSTRLLPSGFLPAQDIGRFAELGVIASMQPTHATSDMGWAQDRVGPERVARGHLARRVA